MMELLAPAGSPEAVIAAVQNGADAVYLGFGDFNARRSAHNFTPEEFEKAVRYCHLRACKVYVTLGGRPCLGKGRGCGARSGSRPGQGNPERLS